MAKKKKLTVYDATKEELIQYFFHPLDGGFRIQADVDRFLIWLKQKRDGELIKVYEDAAEESQKALHEYIEFIKQGNDEPDLDKKLDLFDKANLAYQRYEKMEKLCEKADKKLSESLGSSL